jgi:hypothetical protein
MCLYNAGEDAGREEVEKKKGRRSVNLCGRARDKRTKRYKLGLGCEGEPKGRSEGFRLKRAPG